MEHGVWTGTGVEWGRCVCYRNGAGGRRCILRRRVELNLAQGFALAHITPNRKQFPMNVPHFIQPSSASNTHTHTNKKIKQTLLNDYKIKYKQGKVVPVHAMKAYRERRSTPPPVLTSALDRGEWPRPLYLREIIKSSRKLN